MGTQLLANRLSFPVFVLPTAKQIARVEPAFDLPWGQQSHLICAANHGLASIRDETLTVGRAFSRARMDAAIYTDSRASLTNALGNRVGALDNAGLELG